jgi:hypothetical protein
MTPPSPHPLDFDWLYDDATAQKSVAARPRKFMSRRIY